MQVCMHVYPACVHLMYCAYVPSKYRHIVAQALFLHHLAPHPSLLPLSLQDAALTSLKSLNRNDVVEVRALQHPPQGVKLVIEAVCIMKEVKPRKVPGEKVGTKVSCEATGSLGTLGTLWAIFTQRNCSACHTGI